MNFKQNLIFAIVCFTVAVTASNKALYHRDTDIGLLNLISRSNDLLKENPARSLDCFTYYIPKIDEIVKKYEENYKICLVESESGRIKAEEDTVEQRSDLANKAEVSCARLSKCSDLTSIEEQFQCYIDGGSDNAKTMYEININASDDLTDLLNQYRIVENVENKCTNQTKRDYERESGEAYEEFNNCILGISEVPTGAPSTVDPTTADPTTADPTTADPTTADPTTADPTTADPTTADPTTADPTTADPTTADPTTADPTTADPTTADPTTADPTTADPTTADPTTADPTTADPTTADPTTAARTIE